MSNIKLNRSIAYLKECLSTFSAGICLIVTSEGMLKRDFFNKIIENIPIINKKVVTIGANPEIEIVQSLIKDNQIFSISVVIAIGGGSVLDTAKTMSVFLSASNRSFNFKKVLRENQYFFPERLPLICIPTTSGTGAEVTPFATIWDHKYCVKRSLSSEALVADFVILDPLMTCSASRRLTKICALDTCSHALETLWNKHATIESIRYSEKALDLFLRSMPILEKDLLNMAARADMQLASYYAGRAIAISRTAIAHSISYPLTLHYSVPHGIACSFSLVKISNVITKENLWPKSVNINLIKDVVLFLKKMEIESEIEIYCTKEDRIKLVDEMFTNGRSDNFLLENYKLEEFL